VLQLVADTPSQPGPRRRTLKAFVVLAILAALAIILAIGATPHAAVPAEGSAIVGAAAATRPSILRVATFNIHSGVGADGRLDLERTARALRGFDLIALNEVHGVAPWRSQPQAAVLAVRLQLAWLFVPTERQWGADAFGNAMLTNRPVQSWKRIPLDCTPGRGFRNVLVADLPFGDGTLRLLITHIDRGDDREKQLRTVRDMFLKQPSPALLMGDFNTRPDDPLIKALLSAPGVVDPVGQKLGVNPPDRIDWIFVRGLKWLDAGMVDRGASDHPMVWAEFDASPSPMP
jgi:endonuclease/exonuclease/phosphatase family metal-dependent hydrolase